MDFAKIRELLKGLVNDSLPTEEVEKIGAVVQEIDNAENEFNEFVVKHDDLRKKYIEAVKTSAFQEKPQEEQWLLMENTVFKLLKLEQSNQTK